LGSQMISRIVVGDVCMAPDGDQIEKPDARAGRCVVGASLQATPRASVRTRRTREVVQGSIVQVLGIGSPRFGGAADTALGPSLLSDGTSTKLIAFACGAGVLVEL